MSKYDELIRQVPQHVTADPLIREVYGAQGKTMDALALAVEDVESQLFVDRATWGLDSWEAFTGLLPSPELDDAARRTRIKEALQSGKTLTKARLTEIFEARNLGPIAITEGLVPHTVEVISEAEPTDAEVLDFRETLRKVVPAHIDMGVEFKKSVAQKASIMDMTQRGYMELTLDETKIVIDGANGIVSCFDKATFAELWKHDHKPNMPQAVLGNMTTTDGIFKFLKSGFAVNDDHVFILYDKRRVGSPYDIVDVIVVVLTIEGAFVRTQSIKNDFIIPATYNATIVDYTAHWDRHTQNLVVALNNRIVRYDSALDKVSTTATTFWVTSGGAYERYIVTRPNSPFDVMVTQNTEDGVGGSPKRIYFTNLDTMQTHIVLTDPLSSGENIRTEENSGDVNFYGTWVSLSGAENSGSNIRYTRTQGSYAEFIFTGLDVSLIGRKGPDCGIVRIIIDGGEPVDVDCYNATEQHQAILYRRADLLHEAHIIRVYYTGTKHAAATDDRVYVDAFDVASRRFNMDINRVLTEGWQLQANYYGSAVHTRMNVDMGASFGVPVVLHKVGVGEQVACIDAESSEVLAQAILPVGDILAVTKDFSVVAGNKMHVYPFTEPATQLLPEGVIFAAVPGKNGEVYYLDYHDTTVDTLTLNRAFKRLYETIRVW